MWIRRQQQTEEAKQIQTKSQQKKLVMIPRCGHFVQFEQPKMVNREIRDFVR
jgi:pimeloyl-ACP methyl ester carboxylesterase